jgi:hypothetical protein
VVDQTDYEKGHGKLTNNKDDIIREREIANEYKSYGITFVRIIVHDTNKDYSMVHEKDGHYFLMNHIVLRF